MSVRSGSRAAFLRGKRAHLTRPEGDEGAEGEAGVNSGAAHLSESSTSGDGECAGRAGLDLDLGHLERAESDVGEEFSRGGTREPDITLVFGGGLLTSEVHVHVLEELVQTVLEHTLEGVANQSGAEALPETLAALLGNDGLKTGNKTLVLRRADLKQQKREEARHVRER